MSQRILNINKTYTDRHILVDNIQPYDTSGIITVIPAKEPLYNQFFLLSTVLNEKDFNYISRITVHVDTTGIWNIPVDETFENSGVQQTIRAGYYRIKSTPDGTAPLPKDLAALCNLDFSTTGENAFKVRNNHTLKFASNSNLIYVLGYEDFGTNLIPILTVAGDTINETGDLETLVISSSLIQGGTTLGTNPMAIVVLDVNSPGPAVVASFNVHLPLNMFNFKNVTWTLSTAYGKPYIIQTPIVIFTQISSQQRLE